MNVIEKYAAKKALARGLSEKLAGQAESAAIGVLSKTKQAGLGKILRRLKPKSWADKAKALSPAPKIKRKPLEIISRAGYRAGRRAGYRAGRRAVRPVGYFRRLKPKALSPAPKLKRKPPLEIRVQGKPFKDVLKSPRKQLSLAEQSAR